MWGRAAEAALTERSGLSPRRGESLSEWAPGKGWARRRSGLSPRAVRIRVCPLETSACRTQGGAGAGQALRPSRPRSPALEVVRLQEHDPSAPRTRMATDLMGRPKRASSAGGCDLTLRRPRITAPGEEGLSFLAGDPPSGGLWSPTRGESSLRGFLLEVMRRRRSRRSPASHLQCELPHTDSGMRGRDHALDPLRPQLRRTTGPAARVRLSARGASPC